MSPGLPGSPITSRRKLRGNRVAQERWARRDATSLQRQHGFPCATRSISDNGSGGATSSRQVALVQQQASVARKRRRSLAKLQPPKPLSSVLKAYAHAPLSVPFAQIQARPLPAATPPTTSNATLRSNPFAPAFAQAVGSPPSPSPSPMSASHNLFSGASPSSSASDRAPGTCIDAAYEVAEEEGSLLALFPVPNLRIKISQDKLGMDFGSGHAQQNARMMVPPGSHQIMHKDSKEFKSAHRRHMQKSPQCRSGPACQWLGGWAACSGASETAADHSMDTCWSSYLPQPATWR
jgi:hypothetical protein